MDLAILLLCLVATPLYVHCNVQLVESGPGAVSPGGSFKLTCRVTGDSIKNAWWEWIRQAPGKGLEWVGQIDWDGDDWRTIYASALESRTTLTADASRNEYYLTMRSLTAADSATYYCARRGGATGTYWFDYWGKGTTVTVSSESPKAPSLFPLIPGDSAGDAEFSIGCLAKSFLPNTIDFTWTNPSNQSIGHQNVMKFPSVMLDGTYTAASQAKVSRSTWDRYESFYCKSEHPQGTKVISVAKPYVVPSSDPEMLIRAPVLKAFSSSYQNSTIVCEVSNLCSGKTTIRWFKGPQEITTDVTTSEPKSTGGGKYTIWSKLVVTKEDWLLEKEFTCEVKSNDYTHRQTVSTQAFCKDDGCSPSVNVETIPPTFADIFFVKSANLTCRISNIPLDANYAKLNVTWTQASDHKQLHTVMTSFQDQGNNYYYVDAIATVCATEWKVDETYICKVTFEDILVNPVEKTLEKESVGSPKPPSVYVLPPPLEELALREAVTLICLIKNFSPSSFFVRWLQNEQSISESAYFTSKSTLESKTSKGYFAYSMLTISEQDWSAGNSFSCLVGHEALPYNFIQKTINKNTGKPSVVNVSLVLSDTSNPCY